MREWKSSRGWTPSGDSCPMSAEVVAWLQDEVRIDERAKLAAHFASCDACGRIVHESMEVLECFEERIPIEARPDLLPRVVAELREYEASLPLVRVTPRARALRFSRIAAAVGGG
ncbi:MAG: hypothetical protein ACKVX7_13465, partial [Planctomycetota bacterium]